ncbi:MAG: hypothetical protein A2921_04205 [Candidatus Magasanikbacteria bacterium RIFCSPLOWO2_01_FULL_43_20b]|nr:MAG: hypothetical protein A2921_04205 [Candidatus Magasanikbacteria bacterium RIFCSPLOWO2_01_FULL_43_20b]
MSNKKIFAIIFLLAFLMRLTALFSFAEEKSLLYVNDSQTYLQTAKNILEHGVYSMEISETPHQDNFRTPLYPLFLLPFVWLKTSLYVPAIVQSIIMSFGIGLVFWLGQKIFSRKAAITAAVLFALEPTGALISAQIMAEAIFTPLFLGALFSVLMYIKTSKTKFLWYGSSLLAMSALARPIAFPLFIILPTAVWFVNQHIKTFGVVVNDKYKKIARHAAASLGIFFLIISPWLYFIFFTVHSSSFSSIVWTQGYEYRARYFDEWRAKRGAPDEDRLPYADMRPVNETLDARAIAPIKLVVTNYLKTHFPQYLWFHFIRVPYLFTDSGYASILNGIPQLNFNYDTTHGTVSGGFLEQIDWRQPSQTVIRVENQPLFLVLFFADLFFIVVALLAVANPLIFFWRQRQWSKEIIFLIGIILLYSAIASPIGGPRFRIPINPLLFLLAADTILILNKFRSDTKPLTQKM